MKKSTASIFFTSLIIAQLLSIVDIAYGALQYFDFKKASEAGAILETRIELSISLKNFNDNFGNFYKTCVTYTRHLDSEQWFEYHRTELFATNNEPAFKEKVLIPYPFHEKRKLQFRIYRGKENVRDLNKFTLKGYATCNLVELMKFKKLELPLILDDGKGRDIGLIVIQAEKLVNNYDELKIQFVGKNLKFYKHFSSIHHDPYFEIFKRVENKVAEPEGEKALEQTESTKEYALVYRSSTRVGTLDPKWDDFYIPIKHLCNGDPQREIKFVGMNWEYVVGEFETSLNKMQKEETKFTLIKDTGTEKLPAGEIFIQDFTLKPMFTFSEFLAGGLKLRTFVAIDFSIGHPVNENPDKYNYEEAITLAVTALKDYVWDNRFLTYGFGARTKDGNFSNNLCLSGIAEGTEGVLRAYRENLSNITPGIEANFEPIIRMIKEEVNPVRNYFYGILLVIMHGEISAKLKSSFVDTLNGIHYAPLSVIILGMNDLNLATMKDLYHEKVFRYDSLYSRDVAHFVSFNQFTSNDTKTDESYFGPELLAKLPNQVVKYMSSMKLEPGKF